MGIEVLLGIWALVASVTALLFWNKANAATPPEALSSGANRGAALPAKTAPAAAGSDEALKATEKKLAEVKSDLAAQKDKLVAKQKEVDELKEQARAKARREGKKEQAAAAETEAKAKGPDPRDVEIQSLRKGMAALESQLNAVKRDAASAAAAETSVTQRSAAEVEGAKKVAETERQTRARLEDENASLKKTIDELRAAIKKVDARPDVPGTALNLKELATPVVQELARFFRKGEEFERLYTVAQSQLQLEKDRTLEIQRRYFAVCRELAVVAGAPANVAASVAVQAAEAVVDGEVKISAKPADAAVEGDATKKKRRRRRRRKIAGEPSEVAEGEEGDDGDGEEGDEHDDGDVVAADAADKGGNGDSGASAPA